MFFSALPTFFAGDAPLEMLRLSRDSFTLPWPKSFRYVLAFSHSSFFLADLLAEESPLAGDEEENGFTDLLCSREGPGTPCVCAWILVCCCHDPCGCAPSAGESWRRTEEDPMDLLGSAW